MVYNEVISENGPQYTSRDFKDFAIKWSFGHTSASSYNPQGNLLSERHVQTAKRILQQAIVKGKGSVFCNIVNLQRMLTLQRSY